MTIRTRLIRLSIILGMAYIVVATVIWYSQEKLIFPGTLQKLRNWTVPDGIQSEFITSKEGISLERWYAPAAGQERAIVIHFNGNGGILPHTGWFLKALAASGFSSYSIDYRGFGRSSGAPSETGLYQDAQTLLEHVQSRHNLTRTPLIIWGSSLGGGPATYLAQQNKPAALVLSAGFSSLDDVVNSRPLYWPFQWVLKHHFPNNQRLSTFADYCVIIAHSRDDQVVFFDNAERNVSALSERNRVTPIFLDNADHGLILQATYDRTLKALNQCLPDHA